MKPCMPLQLCACFFSSSVKLSGQRNRCLFLQKSFCSPELHLQELLPWISSFTFFPQSLSRGVQKTDGFELHERFHFHFGLELAAMLSPCLCTPAVWDPTCVGTGWVASMSLCGVRGGWRLLKAVLQNMKLPLSKPCLFFLTWLQQAAQQAAQRGFMHCLTPNVQCYPGTHLQHSSSRDAAASQALLLPGPALKNASNTPARAEWGKKGKKSQSVLLHWSYSERACHPPKLSAFAASRYLIILILCVWVVTVSLSMLAFPRASFDSSDMKRFVIFWNVMVEVLYFGPECQWRLFGDVCIGSDKQWITDIRHK